MVVVIVVVNIITVTPFGAQPELRQRKTHAKHAETLVVVVVPFFLPLNHSTNYGCVSFSFSLLASFKLNKRLAWW